MGYRSQVYLKTTTEGWILLKKLNDSIEKYEDKPLAYVDSIQKTDTGFYKIEFSDIKWYDSYSSVQNFELAMNRMDDQDIPYSFIRIGEDTGDIEHKRSYPDDIPYEIEAFEPVVDVNDEDYSGYEDVDLKSVDAEFRKDEEAVHSEPAAESASKEISDDDLLKRILYDLFDSYKYNEDIDNELNRMVEDGEILKSQYDRIQEIYNDTLNEWEARRRE